VVPAAEAVQFSNELQLPKLANPLEPAPAPAPAQVAAPAVVPIRNQLAQADVSDEGASNLLAAERAASERANALVGQFSQAKSDAVREELRKALGEIFDAQQNRRALEIEAIETRLAKLKDIQTARNSLKDSIIDRRLEVITGGKDVLGWEETEAILNPPQSLIQPGTIDTQGTTTLGLPTLLAAPAPQRSLAPGGRQNAPVPVLPSPSSTPIPAPSALPYTSRGQ
jgi:hypothetical protein